jgi:ribosomal protein S18 acetylase RimI-like enzyme
VTTIEIAARMGTPGDIETLVSMYRDLEAEQAALRPIWPESQGLDEPFQESMAELIRSPDAVVVVGTIDRCVLGFVVANIEALRDRAGDRRVGVVQYIFTADDARGVGIGQAMFDLTMDELRGRGLDLFDAIVSPGHRLAKNFFESQGFKARLIVMNRLG